MASKMNDISIINPEVPALPLQKRVWGGWATAGFGAVIMVVLFLVLIFVVVIMAIVIGISHREVLDSGNLSDLIRSYMGLLVSVAGIVSYAAGTGLVLAFVKARGRAGIAEYLGLKKISWKVVLTVVLITAFCVALTTVIGNLLHIGENDTIMNDLYNSSVWPALLWIVVVVLAPIFEESLFRGFLFEGFRKSRLGVIGTIILTSFVWMFFHLGYDLYSLAAIFLFGLVLGAVRYKTGSLWSTMLMHACYNIVGMTLIALSAAG